MAKSAISLDRYLARSINTVPGFVNSLDIHVIHALLSYQKRSNVTGHLCEIGVHHGQLFLMLALARRPGERALAVDLFEDDEHNAAGRHAGRDRALFENARRLGIDLSEEETFKTSSLKIGPADLLTRTHGPIRFFSVDGGHLYSHVANDLVLAEKTLTHDGIIAVDDFFNPGWADVTFATYDFLKVRDSLLPFAVTTKKLYLAPTAAAEQYKMALRVCSDLDQISPVHILGHDALVLRQGTLKRGYELLRDVIAHKL